MYYTVKDAARILGVTTRTLGRYIADGKIVVHRLSPRAVRIKDTDLEAFLDGTRAQQ